MLSTIRQCMIPAIAPAIERDGSQRNQHVIEDQHAIGPLMPNDKSLAMIERLGVFWMQTGAMLECTIHDNRNIPGQLFQLLPGFGYLGAFGDSYVFRSRCRWRSNTRAKVPLYLAQRSANISLPLHSYHHAPERLSRT
jgi:hypothetical protein